MRIEIILLILAAIAAVAIVLYQFVCWLKLRQLRNRKKEEPPGPPPPPQTKVLIVKNFPTGALTMRRGEQFTPQYEVVEHPSLRLLQEWVDFKLTWWTERDPRAPAGGPDTPVIYLTSAGTVTAVVEGTKDVFVSFQDTPAKKELILRFVVVSS